MLSEGYGNRAAGWIVGATLIAAVTGVTGCSNGTESVAEEKPTGNSSTPAGGETTRTGQEGPETTASRQAVTRQSSAEGAVAAWVTAVITGQPRKACLVMADPATDSSPARVGSPSRCDGESSEVREMRDTVGRLRTSFTPKRSTSTPEVRVADVPGSGDTVLFPAAKVTIDGQPLDEVIVSNSTGLETDELDVRLESTRIDNAWYVTNLDLDIG